MTGGGGVQVSGLDIAMDERRLPVVEEVKRGAELRAPCERRCLRWPPRLAVRAVGVQDGIE